MLLVTGCFGDGLGFGPVLLVTGCFGDGLGFGAPQFLRTGLRWFLVYYPCVLIYSIRVYVL